MREEADALLAADRVGLALACTVFWGGLVWAATDLALVVRVSFAPGVLAIEVRLAKFAVEIGAGFRGIWEERRTLSSRTNEQEASNLRGNLQITKPTVQLSLLLSTSWRWRDSHRAPCCLFAIGYNLSFLKYTQMYTRRICAKEKMTFYTLPLSSLSSTGRRWVPWMYLVLVNDRQCNTRQDLQSSPRGYILTVVANLSSISNQWSNERQECPAERADVFRGHGGSPRKGP